MMTEDTTRPTHRRIWSGLASDDATSEIGILGVPFDGATSFRKGASFAPSKIRELTLHVAPFTEEGKTLAGLRVHDYGDVSVDLDWQRYFKTVESRARLVLNHRFALFLGGDHSVTIPLTRAFSKIVKGSFGMLHIDAHLDLADSFEGSRWSHACTQRRVLELPNIDPKHLAFVGIRSFMDDEMSFLNQQPQISLTTARDVHVRGIDDVAKVVVDQLRSVDAVYITLDIDCLDPAFAPGTGTLEAGGLSTRDVLDLLRTIFLALPVRAMDIVEVSPPLDHSDITSVAAIKMIYEVFGFSKANSFCKGMLSQES
jgi:agmatinase